MNNLKKSTLNKLSFDNTFKNTLLSKKEDFCYKDIFALHI